MVETHTRLDPQSSFMASLWCVVLVAIHRRRHGSRSLTVNSYSVKQERRKKNETYLWLERYMHLKPPISGICV
jgi:hypothetical protein